jgi:hypothetical protein
MAYRLRGVKGYVTDRERNAGVVGMGTAEQTRPSLKSVLLSQHFGERGDEFDRALEAARVVLAGALAPGGVTPAEPSDDRPGLQRFE